MLGVLSLAKKSQEKHGNPGKAWRPRLSWLFPAFLTLESVEKSVEKPGKHGNSWLSWKDRNVLPRKAWKARRGLWAFAESVDFVHTNRIQKSQERQEWLCQVWKFLAFMEKQDMLTPGKPRNPEQKSRLPWKAGNFALTITVQVSQAQEFLAFM